jgi:hypothetical protein
MVLAGIPPVVRAADAPPPPRPIRLIVRPVVGLARSLAPQTFEIGLESTSGKYYEGRLELQWYVGRRLVHEFVSRDLAIPRGGQRMRLTVPPIVMYSDKTDVTVYGQFLTERETIDLGEVPSDVPAITKRTFVIANVQPQELLRPQFERGIPEYLGLEQFNPDPDMQLDMLTSPVRLTPEEMPTLAAGYAGFDLVFMEGNGFRKLNARQLAAIGHWVVAGGSVIVELAEGLDARHVEFLNRLGDAPGWGAAGPATAQPAYALNERGRVVVLGDSPALTEMARYRPGMGRAVVVHRPLDKDFDFRSREWRETVAFLWKIRATQVESIVRWGYWVYPTRPQRRSTGEPSAFAPQRDDLERSIRQLLMPERIEGVPFSVVAVILTLFLLAVAPGDYFLLGRFNCRKYTWWLFVLISGAFTLCTVKIAESYMGHNDYQTSLAFVDLEQRTADQESATTAARTSRFEMLFVSTQRTIEKELHNCLYTDLTDSNAIPENLQFDGRKFGLTETEKLDLNARKTVDLPIYEGAMPAAFNIHQQLRQWSPRIARETTFSDGRSSVPDTGIHWAALPTASLNSVEGRRALYARVLAKEPDAQVLLLNGAWAYDPAHNEDAPASVAATGMILADIPVPGAGGARNFVGSPASVLLSPTAQATSPAVSLAIRASVRPPAGLFAICSQVAPTGGQVLEDLSLLDASDPRQWLVIVVVRRENSWVVYRQLIHERR